MYDRIDHVVIACKSLKETLPLYRDQLGLQALPEENVPEHGIKRVKLPIGKGFLELVEPTDPNGPIAKFLEERGEGIYLMGLESRDLDKTIADLKRRGARIVGEQEPTDAEGIRPVFIHPKSAHGALIALMQKK